ncbi:lipid kinase YegS [Halomonas sp. 18H]|uniref:lipid kinase YegS n=1 Tax=Halomonas almeriensis TaxID=308163 RepID=UPI00223210EF|nr:MULTISPECIES: lipid kinase YegS [Halomonas]MCW4149392.1 lipid kinase YegS [Halomonas sp. 18H]MDN3553662.1 lipid kinase YegS [Halomonas almeriensis]
MSTTRLILNGQSAQVPQVRQVVHAARHAGANLGVQVTRESGHAARLAVQACHEGLDRVIAGGGDGTVNEVVNGLMQVPRRARPALGILPLGSANDLASSLGMPLAPGKALSAALGYSAHAVDVVRLNERYFLNMTTGGFGAEVTSSTPKSLKRLLGGGAYSVIGGLKAWQHRRYPADIRWKEGHRRADLFILALGNGIQSGGGQPLTPGARLDDGLLDVLMIRDVASLLDMVAMRREWQQRPVDGDFVEAFQTRWLSYEGQQALPLTLDGEPLHEQRFTVEVEPLALELAAPSDCPLLGSAGQAGAEP